MMGQVRRPKKDERGSMMETNSEEEDVAATGHFGDGERTRKEGIKRGDSRTRDDMHRRIGWWVVRSILG